MFQLHKTQLSNPAGLSSVDRTQQTVLAAFTLFPVSFYPAKGGAATEQWFVDLEITSQESELSEQAGLFHLVFCWEKENINF